MMPLVLEDYYLAALFLISGFAYIWVGSIMAIKPHNWLHYIFSLMPTTQRRAETIGINAVSAILIRLLGICFAAIAALLLRDGVLHALYIYNHPSLKCGWVS
jgi:hypothetical protein